MTSSSLVRLRLLAMSPLLIGFLLLKVVVNNEVQASFVLFHTRQARVCGRLDFSFLGVVLVVDEAESELPPDDRKDLIEFG